MNPRWRLASALAITAFALAVPASARAGVGCVAVDGECVALPDVPCDEFCTSGVCVGEDGGTGICAGDDCTPCSVSDPAACVEVLAGSQWLRGTFTGGECVYPVDGCSFQLSLSSLGDLPGACLHDGVSPTSFLDGDCDEDGVTNRYEGPGQLCIEQAFVGPSLETAACLPMEACTCARFDGPYGGSVCSLVLDAVGGYGCTTADDCPRAPHAAAPICVAREGASGVCYEGPTCEPSSADCFAWTLVPASTTWPLEAFAAGDCDGDSVPNREDDSRCGPLVLEWTEGSEPLVVSTAPCRNDTDCEVSCLDLLLCGTDAAVGLPCDPAIGCDAAAPGSTCAPLDASSGVGVCVPSSPSDDDCGPRAYACFAEHVGVSERYLLGDCDGDGLPNASDPAVCTPVEGPDAGLEVDGGASLDASVDAALDAAALPRVTFRGSGCVCRASRASSGAGLATPGLLVIGLWATLRRRRIARTSRSTIL